jgi:hypothetical protein
MLKYYVLGAVLLIPFAGFSKSRHSKHFELEGFAVKTDALSLMSSIINKGTKRYYLSGEIYFNKAYSFNIHLGTETENEPGWSSTEKSFGSNFRWYFKQDDCNCSAFFAGIYFSLVKVHQTDNQKLQHNIADSHSISFLEGGLIGGFQTIFAMHFVIDPAVQIGMEFPHDIHNAESMGYLDADKNNGILVRISLGIGYRF